MASEESTGANVAQTPGGLARSHSSAILSNDPESLKALAADAALKEDPALSLLQGPDLVPEVLEQLGKDGDRPGKAKWFSRSLGRLGGDRARRNRLCFLAVQ
jgi:hypothetical protein